jgi:hypothetical protein
VPTAATAAEVMVRIEKRMIRWLLRSKPSSAYQ